MEQQLKQRTKLIGVKIFKLMQEYKNAPASWQLGKQIIRSATSIGCNYRAACRAKSGPDFINKLKVVEEEADETLYWLEVLEETGVIPPQHIAYLKKEVDEIISIMVASIKTLKAKSQLNSAKKV